MNRNIQHEIDQIRMDRQYRAVCNFRRKRAHPMTIIGIYAVSGSLALFMIAIIYRFLQ